MQDAEITVLVVDDDQAVARLLARVIARLGLAVEVCHDAADALRTVTDRPDDFDVIVTDYRMPGMTGQEMLERMYEAGVAIPSIVMSGWAEEVDRRFLERFGVGPVLSKPFSREDLQARLSGLLDTRRDTV